MDMTYTTTLVMNCNGDMRTDFTTEVVHETYEEFISFMNDIRLVYGRLGYSLKALVRKSSDLMSVNYYAKYTKREK